MTYLDAWAMVEAYKQRSVLVRRPSLNRDAPPFLIRPFDSTDESEANFIKSSWMRTIRKIQPWVTHDNDSFSQNAHAPVEELLEAPDTRVVIACRPERPRHIYGAAVGDGFEDDFVLHMVYVAQHYRLYGIGEALVRELYPQLGKSPFTFTTHTYASPSLKRKYDAQHNMFLLHPRYIPPALR